jgi:multidrug efflux pump
MTLSEISIRRPVLAVVMSLLIVAAGLMSLSRLPVRELPDTDAASVTVATAWPGAAPEAVDSQITERIESAISGVSGATRIDSSSSRGLSRTVILFSDGIDVDQASNDVRAAVARVVGALPDEAGEPTVFKNDDDADPIMRLSVISDRMTREDLTDYTQRFILDRLATLPGVASVDVSGGRTPALRVALDPKAMAARRLTATEIIDALAAANVELPAGQITSASRVFQLRADTRLRDPQDFRELVIKMVDGAPVRLGDVALIEKGPLNTDSNVRSEGKPAIGITVQRQSQSNVVAISTAVRAEVDIISADLPQGMSLAISSDDAVFIRASMQEVMKTLGIAVVLVVLVIFVFLGSPRATLAPVVTIPVALIGALAGIYMLGFSINILTLFALILAIGLVVDDSIVVLEACQRRVERGEPPAAAAVRGSKAVTFAVLATSVTLISVFLPIGFLEGQVGRLFTEFGAVLSIAVMVSTFVALSLAPAICARVLRRDSGGMMERGAGAAFRALERGYRVLLRAALGAPVVVIVLASVVGGAAFWLNERIPQELAPKEDRGVFFVAVTAPQGSSVDWTDNEVYEIERRLRPLEESGEATRVFSIIGWRGNAHRAFVVVRLADWDERERSSQEIVRSMIGPMVSIPGVRAFPIQPSGLGLRGASTPLRVKILGPDFQTVQEWTDLMLNAMNEDGRFLNLDSSFSLTQPELRLDVDRAAADDLGVPARDVALTLQTFFAGREAKGYVEDGRERPVILQAGESFRSSAADLGEIHVRSRTSDALIPLSAFVTLREGAASPSLSRYDRLPAISIEGALAEGVDMGSAIERIEELAAQVLPANARLAYDGQTREYLETSGGAMWTFVIALIVVYLVLAAQFESFVDPAAIMLSVPLSITGALATLWWLDASMNIYTQIGLILLVGLMAKNGILIVEYANQLRDEGMSVREAALEASVERLRPVLMTVVSTVLGAAPLVWSTGAGSEAREAIGLVVIGGFGAASILTLFLTPVLWDRLAGLSRPRAAATQEIDRAMATEATHARHGEQAKAAPAAAPAPTPKAASAPAPKATAAPAPKAFDLFAADPAPDAPPRG